VIHELAAEIRSQITRGGEVTRTRMGEVTAVNAGGTVDLTIGGASVAVPDVRYLAPYEPVVGDTVWISVSGSDLLVLGRTAGSSGDVGHDHGKASDSELLDGLDSSAFLRSNGKAADSELLDGVNSTSYVRSRIASGGDPSCPTISDANQFLMTGTYNLSGTNTNGPWGNADGRWWFLQVMAHTNYNAWQRQIAWDMTGGTDTMWTRRLNDAGGGTIGYSAWVAK
jgi:hypothetical protein